MRRIARGLGKGLSKGIAGLLFSGLSVLVQAQSVSLPPDVLDILKVQQVPHGAVTVHAYHSTALDRDRRFYVYTPPGYSVDAAPYPVLYLLHGAGGDEQVWTERGLAHVMLDNLIAEQAITAFVVVMPYGYAYPREPGAGLGDNAALRTQREGFNQDFLQDVIPQAEATFNITREQSGRAIAGLSLGGAQALALGLSHPQLFSRVAGLSPALGATNNPETGGVDFAAVLADPDVLNDSLQLLWLGSGMDDSLFASIQDFDRQLSEHGIEHTFRVTQGGHTWEVWQRYLYELAPTLFP